MSISEQEGNADGSRRTDTERDASAALTGERGKPRKEGRPAPDDDEMGEVASKNRAMPHGDGKSAMERAEEDDTPPAPLKAASPEDLVPLPLNVMAADASPPTKTAAKSAVTEEKKVGAAGRARGSGGQRSLDEMWRSNYEKDRHAARSQTVFVASMAAMLIAATVCYTVSHCMQWQDAMGAFGRAYDTTNGGPSASDPEAWVKQAATDQASYETAYRTYLAQLADMQPSQPKQAARPTSAPAHHASAATSTARRPKRARAADAVSQDTLEHDAVAQAYAAMFGNSQQYANAMVHASGTAKGKSVAKSVAGDAGKRLTAVLVDEAANAGLSAPVVAKLLEPCTLGGRQLEADSEVHGTIVGAHGDRLLMNFHAVYAQDGTTVTLNAVARDARGHIGVPGDRRITSKTGASVALQGLKEGVREGAERGAGLLHPIAGAGARGATRSALEKVDRTDKDEVVVTVASMTRFQVYVLANAEEGS